jgi:hypothetical protein
MVSPTSSQNGTSRTQEIVDLRIEKELEGKHWRMTTDSFVRAVCSGIPEGVEEFAQSLANDPEIRSLLGAFKFAVSEDQSYASFASLANGVANRCRTALPQHVAR